jgi:nicotinamidase-related amidase
LGIEPALDPARTAVLSMDMQTAIVSIYTGDQDAFTARAADVLRHCRERGMTTIHVQVGFRPGLPEVSSRNALFAAVKNSPERQKIFQGTVAKSTPPSRRSAKTSSSPSIGSVPSPELTWT